MNTDGGAEKAMSVDWYLGKKKGELRVKEEGWGPIKVQGPVLEGKMSVEAALDRAARGRRVKVPYDGVDVYDAVLRGHCRLDKTG